MKVKLLLLVVCVAIICLAHPAFAQKKVVIMGSSTAAGYGATSYPLSWAGRLQSSFNMNTTDGIDTTFFNIAVGGYNTYQEMPTGYVPPAGRPACDQLANITKALSYGPDVVIINLPSNDVGAGYTITETMYNLRLMYSSISSSGAKCYITTSQPRNDYSDVQRQALLEMKDSILTQFPVFSINFWDDLVTTDGKNMLRDDRRDPTSPVHPNDIGHEFLFSRVQDKNIFSSVLPVQLTRFNARLKNDCTSFSWHIEQQEPNTTFDIERSANDIDFEKVFSTTVAEAKQSADYVGTDKSALPGKSFYRIKVIEPSHKFYSTTIGIINNNCSFMISGLYTNNNGATVIADISNNKKGYALVSIINTAGVVLQQSKQYIALPFTRIMLPIANYAAGEYYLRLSTDNDNCSIKAFIK
ncbi:SGNH/GDSL hydrolase family protein [Ferruginibacter sp.]|uniref:SGNH/GDSL hydrolase family protein n=1 Tax=Ferruginibacter sp. TaxID=1940288 RepID=UPI00265A668A|nr:SGNH/GDSL hydrolase family protein [Ferruginibacter sp.]